MYIIYICAAIHVIVVLSDLYKTGKNIKAYRHKNNPKKSPYRIGKNGILFKDEFGSRFKIDIDAEFCH